MATRYRTEADAEVLVPEPEAVERLTAMVRALPDDLAAWEHVNAKGNTVPVPVVMEFWSTVHLTAFEVAIATWPDRARYLAWLLDPLGSPWGPDGPRMPSPVSRPYLFPSKNTKREG